MKKKTRAYVILVCNLFIKLSKFSINKVKQILIEQILTYREFVFRLYTKKQNEKTYKTLQLNNFDQNDKQLKDFWNLYYKLFPLIKQIC